jgi:signal transduction histidine kinase
MVQQSTRTAALLDPCVLLGRLADLLAAGAAPAAALELLADGLGLRTAVLRAASGDLLGVGGEVLHAVPAMRSLGGTSLELPVGSGVTLTVVGARPSQLPALRAAAAVLGLALVPAVGLEDLLEAAEQDRDEIADALHDGPLQNLVVARYAADAAVRGADPTLVRDAVQGSLVELRRTLWHLRPRGADGLTGALLELSRQVPLDVEGDLEAAAQLCGVRAAVAYRFVQAVVVPAGGVVTLRRQGELLAVEVTGTLPSPERWARRAQVLGGDLSAAAGLLRLVLPFTDARTEP